MPLQTTESVELGEIRVSNIRNLVLTIPNLGSSVALMIYDPQFKVGGIAHILLPDSTLDGTRAAESPGRYADLAVPELIQQFSEAGGQARLSKIRIVGGAQMFNFGGGGGNLLNIGSRNATALKASLSKLGLSIEKADTGGNKGKAIRFMIATGHVYIRQIGGSEYLL